VALLILGQPVRGEGKVASYFRSDAGVAGPAAGPLPDHFDAPGALRWRVPIDSGHSTPVLVGDKIVLTTYRAAAEELATAALSQETGKQIWRRVVSTGAVEQFHRASGSPAAATPACDGQRLYVFFGSYGLICYDAEGKTIWERRLGPFRDEYGAGSSPVLVDNRIILEEDHDLDSFLMALDRNTGETLWKTPRPDAVRSYSTPAVWAPNGHKELLVAGALQLAGYDPANGQKLWWVDGLARIVIPVPVPVGDRVYMASWAPGGDSGKRLSLDSWENALAKGDKNKDGKLSRAEIDDREVLERFYRMDLDQSGTLEPPEWERHAAVFQRAQNALLSLKPNGRGELSANDLLWKHQRGVPYVSTPVVDKGILWMVKDGGIITKLDAATGRLLQEERAAGLGGYYASPVAGDGKVYFASEQGVVTVLASQPEWNVISSYNFKEKIYATPVLDHRRVYIRTDQALCCFEAPVK
jgi:outer membrane protein assembly factor BamB